MPSSNTKQLENLRIALQIKEERSAKELCSQLGISQPQFSRIVATIRRDLLISGKARSTRYSLRREVQAVGNQIPLYQVDSESRAQHVATINSIWPKGFYVESHNEKIDSAYYEDLPFFIDDLRPSGFLGRYVPLQHSKENYPRDIRLWTSDHCLHYLSNFGWDSIGNFILGDKAYHLFESFKEQLLGKSAQGVITEENQEQLYPQLAKDILLAGKAGSSAGGEQAKFQAFRSRSQQLIPVIVKFSPPLENALAQRRADLLIAEHIAHQVLQESGIPTTRSTIIICKKQVFLELERFDRVATIGRRGVVSLAALDAHYTGELDSWTNSSHALFQQKLIDESTAKRIQWLDLFGELIANADRHAWNLSFLTDGQYPKELAPVYDMLPMLYAPYRDQLVERNFSPQKATPRNQELWNGARKTALTYWLRLTQDKRISPDFRRITKANHEFLSLI